MDAKWTDDFCCCYSLCFDKGSERAGRGREGEREGSLFVKTILCV